jgi:hypothetical protein
MDTVLLSVEIWVKKQILIKVKIINIYLRKNNLMIKLLNYYNDHQD